MKTLVGIAIASVLSVGAANAAITLPAAGAGELIEWVVDNNNGHVYARGIQVSETAVLPAGQIQSVATYNPANAPVTVTGASLNVAPDANLTTFLAQGGGTDSFSFGLMAAGSRPTTPIQANQPGGYIFQFTSGNTIAAGNLTPTNTPTLVSEFTNVFNDATTLSSLIGGTAGDGKSADVSANYNGNTSAFALLYDQNIPLLGALGTNMNLYAETGGGSVNALAQLYTDGLVTMTANGTLKSVAAVPLPAALWLLGSGLVGLAGVGRRRLAVAA
jgi:hypothetical protein